jgi:site-specific recombinase XerD
VVRATLEQLQRTAGGDKVFTCGRIREKFRMACATAKLTGLVPHSLRHTFATRLVQNGVDLRTVQELGGWSSLSLVERYSHVSPSRKAEAVEGLVPNSTTPFATPAISRIVNTA